jgi:hypothetical protein
MPFLHQFENCILSLILNTRIIMVKTCNVFFNKCPTEKPTIYVYTSPFHFSTVTENMRQICEWLIRTETQGELILVH